MNPKIAIVICPHGFGHIRRVCELLSEFYRRNALVEIHLFVKPKHFEQFKNYFSSWTDFPLSEIHWQTIPMKLAPDFQNESYFISDYFEWISDMVTASKVNKFDLVLSDNLYGVLEAFPHSIVQGSFSWCEITSTIPVFNELGKKEKEHLIKYRPIQICLDRMATPMVKEFTLPIFTNWWCVKNKSRKLPYTGRPNRILLTAGGTSSALNQMSELVDKLKEYPQFVLMADNRLHQLYPENTLEFNFSDEEFNSLDLIIARPGIGILTESVKYSIPLFCLAETAHFEMSLNALHWSDLKFGLNLIDSPIDKILNILFDPDTEGNLNLFRTNLLLEPGGGQIQAFEYLYKRLMNYEFKY